MNVRLALCLSLFLVACSPSVKPQMKAATDTKLSSIKGGKTVDAPDSYKPQEWEVGQWIAYKVTQKDKPPPFSWMKIASKDGDGIWIESEQQDDEWIRNTTRAEHRHAAC